MRMEKPHENEFFFLVHLGSFQIFLLHLTPSHDEGNIWKTLNI